MCFGHVSIAQTCNMPFLPYFPTPTLQTSTLHAVAHDTLTYHLLVSLIFTLTPPGLVSISHPNTGKMAEEAVDIIADIGDAVEGVMAAIEATVEVAGTVGEDVISLARLFQECLTGLTG